MARSRIIGVGIDIPGTGAEVETTSLRSKASLLDYDIAVINPAIDNFYGYSYEEYLGKPCLDDSNSFSLKEHIEHWRREILEAVRAGKNVFFMLNQEQIVYVATGEKTFSGTGRNRQATRHVTSVSNYQLVPGGITVTNSNGSSMVLVGKDNVMAPYWSALQDVTEFRVFLDGQGLKPLVQTRSGNKTVGGKLRYKNADGNLLLLPFIDFELDEYTYVNEKDKKSYWTKEAIALGKRFVASICEFDKTLRSTSELSAQPDWLTQDKFVLPKEEIARAALLEVEAKIDEMQKEKEQIEQRIADESVLKRLLYEKGKPLEASIRMALEIIGFSVSHYKESDSEFDVVFESKEGRVLGEAEGKDNKAINIDKLRQLEMNIHEDFSRDEVSTMAKGALIGNAYRLIEPENREAFFTEKCLTAANRSGTALIRTVDLFYASRYLSGKTDEAFSKKCREAILATTGIVEFPEIPETNNICNTVDETKNA